MVVAAGHRPIPCLIVSVLALSSRFDGLPPQPRLLPIPHVSVLALSSRFDGRHGLMQRLKMLRSFQYSLCRVVLMVLPATAP